MLLIIALVAVLLGIILLALEVSDYPDRPPWSGVRTAWLQMDRPFEIATAEWCSPAPTACLSLTDCSTTRVKA